jgi:hypothetical protein
MKPSMIAAFAVLSLATSGCETLNGPQAVANAEAQRDECKVVALKSAAQLTTGGGTARAVPRDDVRHADATLEANRLSAREVPSMRSPGGPHDTTTARIARAC